MKSLDTLTPVLAEGRWKLLLVCGSALVSGCASQRGAPQTAHALRSACEDVRGGANKETLTHLEAAVAEQTNISVRLRAVPHDELERRLGVALFPRDVALLEVSAIDRAQPCCGAHVDVALMEGKSRWDSLHGADTWLFAGLTPPRPAVMDAHFEMLGLFVDFATRAVTLGSTDFQARGTKEWFPVIEPGTPGSGTPAQALGLGRLNLFDSYFGEDGGGSPNDLSVYSGWAKDQAMLLGAPETSSN